MATDKTGPTIDKEYLANLQHMGDEPAWLLGETITSSRVAEAINWYACMASTGDARRFLVAYLRTSRRVDDADSAERIPNAWLPENCGWIARILTRGAEVPERTHEFFEKTFRAACERIGWTEEGRPPRRPRPSVQDAAETQAGELSGAIEMWIDLRGFGAPYPVYDEMKRLDLSGQVAGRVKARFERVAAEAETLVGSGADRGLLEGYSHLTQGELRERSDFYRKLLEECDRYSGAKRSLTKTAKKTRGRPKPKEQATEKKLQHLQFQRDSAELKVSSVPPAKIVGAQRLITLNTRYKLVTIFDAADRTGLDVRRSFVEKFDEKRSFTCRAGRKVEELVRVLLNGAPKQIDRALAELKRLDSVQHRINENVILLRVIG